MLARSGSTLAAAWWAPLLLHSAEQAMNEYGYVVGEPMAEQVGAKVLAEGGNAFDAIAAGALTAAIAAPYQTGIGGYGGCATLATAGGKVSSLDFNSTAPAAAQAEMFRRDAAGNVPNRANEFGWLATGVPGILAGAQLLIDRYGSRKFAELAQPAIGLARDGIPANPPLVASIKACAAQFSQDAGSRKLYLAEGKTLAMGETFRNLELAEMLSTLAARGTVQSFYEGDIAQRIANGFQKNGGLVTARDMAAYRAREVEPLAVTWGDKTIYTAPLTAGGMTVLQTFRLLEALRWGEMPSGFAKSHTRIEALRLVWRDRLTLLGDPEFTNVPVAKLMSAEYAREGADKISAAVREGKFIPHTISPRAHDGTINLAAADKHGNFISLTLTHGNSFGARVTVDGLGLTLGHGMSRFDVDPKHPNAPGPGKRPLHNMCPSVVTRGGKPVLAAGARGGRKIPNAIFEVLTQFALLDRSLSDSIAAPRPNTEGDATIAFEKAWPADEVDAFRRAGYDAKTAASATVSAVALENGKLVRGMR